MRLWRVWSRSLFYPCSLSGWGWRCGPEGAPPAPETQHPEDEMLTYHVGLCNLDRLWAWQKRVQWQASEVAGGRARGKQQTVTAPAPPGLLCWPGKPGVSRNWVNG